MRATRAVQEEQMSTEGLVSVVIPAYNVASHIAEAIESVLAQGYPELEIIVVDDGSSDDTAEVVAGRFPQAHLVRKANGGAASARNVGIRAARGQYVAFLDADDVWLAGKLNAQIDYLVAHPEVGLVCSGFSHWLADDTGAFPDPATQFAEVAQRGAIDAECSGWVYHKLLLHNFVWTTTVVMRRALIDRIGEFDEALRLGQDYDYFLRAARETEIHRLSGVMALYRHHGGSATARGTDTNYGAQVLSRAVAQWGLSSPNGESISTRDFRNRISKIHFMSAYHHYRCGNARTAVREFLASARIRPLQFKSWAYAALSAFSSLTGRAGG